MKRRIIKLIILCLTICLATGCWDYIGINELTIVTGMAIDKNENDKYSLTFEIINTEKSHTNETIITEIIESTGETIFDGIRNAKRKVRNKLYFSDMPVIIVSNQIVKNDGMNTIIDFFMRDDEIRQKTNLAISKEKTAKEILKAKAIDSSSIGFEMSRIINADNFVTSATPNIDVYRIYTVIHNASKNLALPLFEVKKNDNKQTIELYGTAAFDKDKLIGYLNADESKSYLFLKNDVAGGIIPLEGNIEQNGKKSGKISLEIKECNVEKIYTYKKSKFNFKVNVNLKVYGAEINKLNGHADKKTINDIQLQGQKKVKKDIQKVIDKAKEEFKADIFSFGHLVYMKNPKLWEKAKDNWNQIFIESKIDINVKIEIVNTAGLK